MVHISLVEVAATLVILRCKVLIISSGRKIFQLRGIGKVCGVGRVPTESKLSCG
jgi:hypothetical protein